MTDFFEIYRAHLIYALLVIITVLVLRGLTNLLNRWLLNKGDQKFPGERPKAVNLVKRILNSLWIVLGLIALGFIFVGENKYAILKHNFLLILYLGSVAVITIALTAFANLWFKREIQRKATTNADATSLKFLGYVVVFVIYTIGLLFGLLAFPAFKGITQTALGGAGVLALIAGVASQEALANLVGGIFIISFKPFKIGDIIKVSDTMVGTVVDITLRHTIIRNFENKMIVIPNAIINKEKLINYNLGDLKCCERIEIGISYDSDVTLAKRIMQEECEKHPLIYDNRSKLEKKDGQPMVRTALISLDDSSVTIRAWAWARNYGDSFNLRCDILESVKMRFDKEGIEIPFPYRTLVIKENIKKEGNSEFKDD
ncbi:mechanosensitive ion channel family protein [Arenibacter certesii]|uniref:Mechanosensitive ion channel protein MscS n=1 Tax=Arenibacter certesii TaxID=228955 RepID=A0A918MJA6_9FLAO|nr:mechanosensitive ion channel family protein [Arenibacter certesii]GGW26446.1 mechanosensitive ion channel protein MscS [Arenibacter certesii]